jgi:hypothetical protein
MIEQLSNSVTFYAHYIASKVSATGLTVTVDVYEITKAGTPTEIVTAGSATEVGDGLYLYVLASGSVDEEGEYLAVFKTTDSSVDQQHIPAAWSIQRAGVEQLDAAISSRSDLTAAQVNAEADTALADYDPPTDTEMLAAFAALNDLSAAAVNAEVDTALADYDGPTDAEMLAAISGLNDLDAAAVWAYVTRTLTSGGGASAADVWSYATRTLTAQTGGVTVISAVSGSTITVYQYDTWLFTVTDSGLALTDYDNMIFAVKAGLGDSDAEAILFVDITTGLLHIGGAAASGAGVGSLTKNSATSFTVQIAMSEVAAKIGSGWAGMATWYLKGIDTDDDPDEGFVRATGRFVIEQSGARAIV